MCWSFTGAQSQNMGSCFIFAKAQKLFAVSFKLYDDFWGNYSSPLLKIYVSTIPNFSFLFWEYLILFWKLIHQFYSLFSCSLQSYYTHSFTIHHFTVSFEFLLIVYIFIKILEKSPENKKNEIFIKCYKFWYIHRITNFKWSICRTLSSFSFAERRAFLVVLCHCPSRPILGLYLNK